MRQRLRHNALSHPFESDHFSGIGTFRRRIFGVRAIDIEPTAVRQHFVQLPIVVRPRPFTLPIDFKPAGIQQRIFILVVPHRVGRGQIGVMTNEMDRIGHRIGRVRIPAGDAKLGLRADDTGWAVRMGVVHEILRTTDSDRC